MLCLVNQLMYAWGRIRQKEKADYCHSQKEQNLKDRFESIMLLM